MIWNRSVNADNVASSTRMITLYLINEYVQSVPFLSHYFFEMAVSDKSPSDSESIFPQRNTSTGRLFFLAIF